MLKKSSELVKEPVMKTIKNYFKHMDSENLNNICAEELNDLTKEIYQKVGLEIGAYYNGQKFKCQHKSGWFSYKI